MIGEGLPVKTSHMTAVQASIAATTAAWQRAVAIGVGSDEPCARADCIKSGLELLIGECAIKGCHDHIDLAGCLAQLKSCRTQALLEWLLANHKEPGLRHLVQQPVNHHKRRGDDIGLCCKE
jgi:hypothetical protein